VLPTVDAWNVTVKRQLTNTISIEAAYVGSHGSHGFAGNGPNYDVNPAAVGAGTDPTQAFIIGPDGKPSATPCPIGSTPHPTSTTPGVCGAASYAGFTPLLSQNLRRPLCRPDGSGNCTGIPFDLGNYYGNDASSSYNAFEVKAEKRFSNGLQFLTHYTYAKAYNYTDSYYAISHKIAWGPVDFNRNQVWVLNTVYELPFGKGKQFMGSPSKAMNYVIGGWQVSNTTNWSSGLPWTPSFANCGAEQDVGQCRPDKGGSGSLPMSVGSLQKPNGSTPYIQYFNPVATMSYPDPNGFAVGTDACGFSRPTSGPFVTNGCGTIGNFGRNVFHGPSGFYSDLSIVKKIPITERFNMQFRMDAYNIFNHPVYAFSGNNGAQTCIDCQGGNNGRITALEDGTNMRQLQFGLRFDF
jgi:hypothetical protein